MEIRTFPHVSVSSLYFRMFIWRSILRLPENHAAYAALVDKGTHPAFDKLDKEYPIKSRRLLRILQRYVQKILTLCRPEAPKWVP